MTRSAARRPHTVQADKSHTPASPAFDHAPEDTGSTPATATTPWYWRLVLFLWLTSFIFLLLYEWLAGILKSWHKS